jgi:[NiFe] hydrogenase diaphorase moiety small subunit
VCTVKVDGRTVAACTCTRRARLEVESRHRELNAQRKTLLQMLFVEGNHFCPSCEKSGNCLLQATAYEMGMEGPHFEEFYPDRPVDASHPDILLDFNRCILCELCVRASRDVDGKNVFAIGGHGIGTRTCWSTAPAARLGDTDMALGRPRRPHLPGRRDPAQAPGFAVPIGERRFDAGPIADPEPGGLDAAAPL